MGFKKLKQTIVIIVAFMVIFTTGCNRGDSSTGIGKSVDAEHILTLSVAAYRDDEYIQEIINIDTETGESTLITTDKGMYVAPLWSPDGTQLAYSSGIGMENGKQSIKIIDKAGNELKVLPNLGGDDTVIGWSQDGKRLLVQELIQDEVFYTLFYIVNIESGEAELVGDFREDSFETIQYAQWSPDEKYVIFAAADDDGMSSIYRLDISDGNLVAMTQGYYDDTPKWSPDGEHIIFTRLREEDSSKLEEDEYNPSIDIWLADATGNEFKCIARDEFVDHLDVSWSPDGKNIVFIRSPKDIRAQNELVLYSIESGEEKVLERGKEYKYMPAMSPDGKIVAFASFDDSDDEQMPDQGFDSSIYVIDIDEGKPKKFSTFTGDIYTLEWGGIGGVD